jgi:hypothetical protein
LVGYATKPTKELAQHYTGLEGFSLPAKLVIAVVRTRRGKITGFVCSQASLLEAFFQHSNKQAWQKATPPNINQVFRQVFLLISKDWFFWIDNPLELEKMCKIEPAIDEIFDGFFKVHTTLARCP